LRVKSGAEILRRGVEGGSRGGRVGKNDKKSIKGKS
jgi:hypothetical protein